MIVIIAVLCIAVLQLIEVHQSAGRGAGRPLRQFWYTLAIGYANCRLQVIR